MVFTTGPLQVTIWGVFTLMNRVIFLVDGFNLYHSLEDLRYELGITAKWLDLHSLCSSYLPHISKDAVLHGIFYFSAFAHYLNDASVIKRHRDLIKCLKATGVEDVMGRFKSKSITCKHCEHKFKRQEEKETDVAMASKLFEILFKDKCDTVVVVTGDTDIVPAIKTSKTLFPGKSIRFVFPYGRTSGELGKLAPGSFDIHPQQYLRHQFTNPFRLPNGTTINKPPSW